MFSLNFFSLAICWSSLLTLEVARAQTAPPPEAPRMIQDWSEITPSPDVAWTPCFASHYTCTRLQVPLDYDDPSRGTAAIAMIRIAAVTQPAPNVLYNPGTASPPIRYTIYSSMSLGGPGGSGVSSFLDLAPTLVSLLSPSVNIIGFDPRGVNNTTPPIDCFPDAHGARTIFRTLYFRDVSDGSSTSLATQFFTAEAYGKWCSNVIGGTGPNGTARFAGSAAVSRDMLTYAEAEQRALGLPEADAKVWFYGVSYGTVLGVTFASMFPDRVGRMILDGVMDAEDYYQLQWRSNLADADKVVDKFFEYCFEAGSERCAFWGPSVQDIQARFDDVIATVKERPVPAWNTPDMPHVATYGDLKQFLVLSLYAPLFLFPVLAIVLRDLWNGNGTSLIKAARINLAPDPFTVLGTSGDAGSVIPCVDGFGKNNVTSLEAWREHANALIKQSRYVGDTWGHNPLDCVAMDVPPPDSAVYRGPLPPSAKNTSFPLLFTSNTLDPVTPIRSARRMSTFFPGSVVLAQDDIGHAIISNPSSCTIQHFQAYVNGTIPQSNITCRADVLPFIGRNVSM